MRAMAIARVRNSDINYAVLGERGPWIALSPGGRRGLEAVEGLASRVAEAGYRVVIHDRRNTGASDIVIQGQEPEFQIWADDLHELLTQLGALPAVIGGSSSGCRTSLVFARRYPDQVRALLLWRVTGGPFAARRLAEQYYGQYMTAARQGGMQAVSQTEHWAERIERNPANRDRLLSVSTDEFLATMDHWRQYFLQDADLPVIGATEEQLRAISVPTCIVPGNDRTHGHAIGEAAHRLIPNSELHDLFPGDQDVDLVEPDVWTSKDDEMAAVFVNFLERVGIRPQAAVARTG
jgi:pimeloyl-ACP methyl ester carboxylesterase